MPIRLFFSSIHMSFLSNSSAKTDKLNPVIPIPKKTKTTDNLKKTIQTPQKNISNLENLLLEQTNTKNSLENNTVLDFANKDFDNTFAQKTKLSAENLSQDIAFKSIFDSSDDLKPFANLNTENDQKNKIFEKKWGNELGNLDKIDRCKKIIQGKSSQKIANFDVTLTQSDTVISFRKPKKEAKKQDIVELTTELKTQEAKIEKETKSDQPISKIESKTVQKNLENITKQEPFSENNEKKLTQNSTKNLVKQDSTNETAFQNQTNTVAKISQGSENNNQNENPKSEKPAGNLYFSTLKFRENWLNSSLDLIDNLSILQKNINQKISQAQTKIQTSFQNQTKNFTQTIVEIKLQSTDKTKNQLNLEKKLYQIAQEKIEKTQNIFSQNSLLKINLELEGSIQNSIQNYTQKSTQIWANSQVQIVKSYEFIKLVGGLIITFLQQIWGSVVWQSYLLWGQIQSLNKTFQEKFRPITRENFNLDFNLANIKSSFKKDFQGNGWNSFQDKLTHQFYNNFQSNLKNSFQNFNLKYQPVTVQNSEGSSQVNFLVNFAAPKNQFFLQDFWDFFKTELIRDFWWLETKVEARKLQMRIFKKLKKILNQFLFLVKKFYLLIFTVLILVGFNFGHILAISKTFNNFTFQKNNFSQVQFDTISRQERNSVIDFRSFNSQNSQGNLEIKKLGVKKIIAHTFEADDSVAKLAELYNLSIATIKFNNQIETDKEPEIGKTIYIPWENGYILHIPEETEAEQLAEIYKLDAKAIIETNLAFWNQKTGKFGKNNLLLLPTTDFEKIANIQKDEKNRISNLQEADKQRQKMLSYTAVETENLNKNDKKSGFIWPAVGSISRCLQPGHIACDIANFSSPPIFAVQDGVVLEAGWRDGGFGYMAVVDHGTGLQTVYMHMEYVQITKGQKLVQGQTIGKMGCTGNCSGIHLHFEVRLNKVQQNPLLYLP